MRKRPIYWLMTGVLLCFYSTGKAQPDNPTMAASLIKAEKKLSKMFWKASHPRHLNMKGYLYFGREDETVATYIKGYGVVVKLPRVSLRIRRRRVQRTRKKGDLYINLGHKAKMRLSKAKYKYRDRVYYIRTRTKNEYKYELVDRDKVVQERRTAMKAQMQKFLAEANDLMSQLADNEKIELVYDHRSYAYNGYRSGRDKSKLRMPQLMIAFVDKKTWSQNKNKSTITEQTPEQPDQQLQVMAGIIEGLYKKNVAQSFYGYSRVRYTKLGKIGVLYDLRLNQRVNASHRENYISVEDGNVIDSDSIRARKSGNYEEIKAKRQQANRKAYQKFEQEVKQYLIEYGKVLQGLDASKRLVLNVALPERWYTTDDKQVPRSVQVSVKASVLKGVMSGKITEASAKSQVVLQKY